MSNQARRYERNSSIKARKLEGTSPHVPKNKWEQERQQKAVEPIKPKTNNQKLYLHMLEQLSVVVASGSAGTGKSYVACQWAARLLLAGKIEKLVLTRPYASIKTMGFNSGNLVEKITPFLLPMLGYLREALSSATVDIMLEDGRIEIVPLEVIRGRSFKNAVVLVDECQSCEITEIQAITTRIGENCTLVCMGDAKQNDVKNGKDGLTFLCDILQKHEIRDAGVVEFGEEDIVRSGITKDFVIAYNKEGWQ
jgi:phosphate starvation-inducible PhoH-like protein